jgi:hypothetical protein
MSGHPSRRQILRSILASSGLGLAIGYPAAHSGDRAHSFRRIATTRSDRSRPV